MRRFFKSTGFKIFAAVTAALLAGTIIAAFSRNNASPATSAVSTVFGFTQRISSFIADKLSAFSINFKSSASLAKENEKLEKEIEDLRSRLVGYEQAKQELALYEEFLELKEVNPEYEFVFAAVIGRDAADKFYSFTLNRGSLHGVSVNDPVIYGKYLVGRVISVQPGQCAVGTLLNPEVHVSAYEVRTREEGFVSTAAALSAQGLNSLEGLDKKTSVAPGGIVCTSGIGGIYPRDLIIGTVIGVSDQPGDISAYATVKSGVDIRELKDVSILTAFGVEDGAGNAGD